MDMLWIVPVLPLAGFLILCVTEGKLPKVVVACIGAGSVGLSAVVATLVGWEFVASGSTSYSQVLWTWMVVGDFDVSVSLYLDYLALVMVGVITGVGFLIHLYATGYMWEEEGYSRFFAYMNLFVFAMLLLVLGDSLLLLFLGWEGVGLCSYLLIGFFHKDPENGYAARKAFVVTRVGDTALILGLFLLFRELGTLDIQQSLEGARTAWPEGSTMNTAIALLLLGGCNGRSDSGLGVDSRGNDGYCWRVFDCTDAGPLLAFGNCNLVCGCGWAGHIVHRIVHSTDAVGHQTCSGVFHYEPDRLHVFRTRCRSLVGGYFPPDDPRIF